MLFIIIFFVLMAALVIIGDKVDKSAKAECVHCKDKDCNWCGKTDIY